MSSPYFYKMVFYEQGSKKSSQSVVSGTDREHLVVLLDRLLRKNGGKFELIFFGASKLEEREGPCYQCLTARRTMREAGFDVDDFFRKGVIGGDNE